MSDFQTLFSLSGADENVRQVEPVEQLPKIDSVSAKLGRDSIRFAVSGLKRAWAMKSERRRSGYTTNWAEVLTVA